MPHPESRIVDICRDVFAGCMSLQHSREHSSAFASNTASNNEQDTITCSWQVDPAADTAVLATSHLTCRNGQVCTADVVPHEHTLFTIAVSA